MKSNKKIKHEYTVCMYGSFVAQLIVLIMFGTMKFFLVHYFFLCMVFDK